MTSALMLEKVSVNTNPSDDALQASSSSPGSHFKKAGGNSGKGRSLDYAMLAPLP
jgi:hypothetical protein